LNELRLLAYHVGLTEEENYLIGILRVNIEDIVICKEIEFKFNKFRDILKIMQMM